MRLPLLIETAVNNTDLKADAGRLRVRLLRDTNVRALKGWPIHLQRNANVGPRLRFYRAPRKNSDTKIHFTRALIT